MKLTRTFISSMVLAAGLAAPAFAGLGGDATSVEADRASLKGALRVSARAGFTMHEIESSSGLLHEYVGPEGKVFAVTWRGPGIPDMRKLLGSYYGQVQQAASAPHSNHHHFSVRTPLVVVESSAHLRTFSGRAWAPALLPQSVSLNDIN